MKLLPILQLSCCRSRLVVFLQNEVITVGPPTMLVQAILLLSYRLPKFHHREMLWKSRKSSGTI
jgi:hypothetical protein